MNTTLRIDCVCWIILAIFTSTTIAQDDVLRGPDLDAVNERTIVRHTMSGEFEQVEGRPEMAAFAAVVKNTGSDTKNEQAIEIELDRTVELSLLLIDQIDLMKESTDAMLAGDQQKAQEIQSSLHTMFDPDHRHDPLTPALLELLDKEQQQRYTRILDQYWNAWIDWTLRNNRNKDKQKLRERTRQRLTTRLFQRELADAYDISLKRYRDAMEAIYNAVQPTDEQRSAIRDIVIQHIKDTRLDATPEQRRETMHTMYEILDEERQQRLFDYLLRIVVPDE